jgi:two-component system chemotaxis response regulator CheB
MKSRALVIRQPVSIERKRPSIVSLRTPRPLFAAVLIGSSTGGPEALARVLPHLGLPVPVLIAQHMTALFTPMLAARLAHLCSAGVQEGVHGMTVRGGDIVIAPGDRHLRIAHESEAGLRLEISSDPPVNFCRPSVDVLFESAATTLADRTLAVILTGMGADGTSGALRLKSAGATIYVQDEQSSVVWGMPGAATRAGVPDRILSLSAIGAAVARTVMHGRGLSPATLPASPGVSHVPHPRT